MRCARSISPPAGCCRCRCSRSAAHTADAARAAGFDAGDRGQGRRGELARSRAGAGQGRRTDGVGARCCISPAPTSRAISRASWARRGLTVVTHTTYRMAPVASPARRDQRRLHGEPDHGGAALFPPQRAGVPGGDTGRRDRDFGARRAAMLHFGGRRRGARMTPAPPSRGGGAAGRNRPAGGA